MMNYVLIVLMSLIAAFASFFFKKTTMTADGIVQILQSKFFYLGGVLYVGSALLNIYLLQRMPYALVAPLGGINYIWSMLIAWRFLGEKIGRRKLLGVGTILIGVILIAS